MAESVWEQLPGETPRAFGAFAAYRDLDRSERSIRAAYRRHTGREHANQATGTWYIWSSQFHWIERAAAWDAELDRAKRQALREEVERLARRHLNVAGVFESLVVQRLQKFNEQAIAGLTPGELAKWFEMAVRIQRQALGLQDEQKINMTVVFQRAQELAEQYGVSVEEIMAEAELAAENHATQ